MPPDVLLFIEHAARELDVACVLKCLLLERHGMTLEIASLQYDLHRVLCRRPPRVVATPFFSFAADANLSRIIRAFPTARLVNLAYEQLLGPGNAAWKKPSDAVARHHVLHLAGGDAFRRFLCRSGVDPAHAPVVGSLPLGLYRPPYRAAAEGQRHELARRHGLDPLRPWIFFPENYSAAFLSDRELAERVARGFPAGQATEYRSFAQRALTEAARWCYLASGDRACEIILRPRPGVSLRDFRGFIERRCGPIPDGSFHLIKDGTVREWNMAADVVVTSYSSTAVEAAVADRPVFLLEPEPLPESLRMDWTDHAAKIVSCDDFHELVGAPRAAPRDERLRHWAEANLLGRGDPLADAAEWLARAVAGEGPLPPGAPSGQWKPLLGRQVAQCIKRWTSRRGRVHPRYELDRLDKELIARRTAAWSGILAGGGVPA